MRKEKSDVCSLTEPDAVEASTNFSTKVDLTWSGSPDADGFYIYRSTLSRSGTYGEFEKVGESSAHSYSDYSVSSSSEYRYKVEAYCSTGGTSSSEITSGKTGVITVAESFETLGSSTGGSAVDCPNSSELPGTINTIIDDHLEKGTDLVFLVDNTGSMLDDINAVKNQLNTIIANLPRNTRVGVAFYKDQNVDNPWYGTQDITSDMTLVKSFIDNMEAEGGGDIPESVYDGLYKVLTEMNWRPAANRAIIVIGDAPPLEGSLTTHSLSDVVTLCTRYGAITNLYPIITSAVYTGFRTTGGSKSIGDSN